MERNHCVYALIAEGNPIYIGQGLPDRPYQHRPALKSNKHKNPKLQNKVNKLWRESKDFSERILVSDISEKQSLYYEKRYIHYYRQRGIDLCNIAEGGTRKGGKFSAEHRQAMSKARMGMKLSPSHVDNMIKGLQKNCLSPNGNPHGKLCPSDVCKVYDFLETSMTYEHIAREIGKGLCPQGVGHINRGNTWSYLAKDLGIKLPIRSKWPSFRKLDSQLKEQILKRVQEDPEQTIGSRQKIADEFGVSLATIYRIKRSTRNG